VPRLLAGEPENDVLDAQGIQPFYTGLVARAINMNVTVTVLADKVSIEAKPVEAQAQAPMLAETAQAS
jgi:histidine phosphotransferase ChpT